MNTKLFQIGVMLLVATRAYGACVGDCENGFGTQIYENGAKYSGYYVNGAFNGKGILIYTDGITEYIGDFVDSEPHGYGSYEKRQPGRVVTYTGEFRNGKMNGLGEYYRSQPNGYHESYSGEWKDDYQSGYGEIEYSSGSTYVGEWKKDKRHGHGVYTWANGERFVGAYENDKRTEEGEYYTDVCTEKDGEVSVTSKGYLSCLSQAKAGDAFAQYVIAEQFEWKDDYALAEKWFLKAFNQGHKESKVELIRVYLHLARDESRKEKKALSTWGDMPYRDSLLEAASKLESAEAQFKIGMLHKFAEGAEEKYFKWMKKSAENGEVEAQEQMVSIYSGYMLGDAWGNIEKEIEWLKKAALQYSDNSKVRLAYKYQYGEDVPQSYAHAYFLYNTGSEKERANELLSEMSEEQVNRALFLEKFYRKKPLVFPW